MTKLFESVEVSKEQTDVINLFNASFESLWAIITNSCPEGRYKSIAITKLEEAAMFATKAISHG